MLLSVWPAADEAERARVVGMNSPGNVLILEMDPRGQHSISRLLRQGVGWWTQVDLDLNKAAATVP